MQDMWEECLKKWDKINQKMRNIQFPGFGTPEDFTNLSDIVKQIEEHDRKFEYELLEIKNLEKGQVNKFTDGSTVVSLVLRHSGSKVDHFKIWVVEMRDELTATMEQHRFPYLHSYKDLFSQCSEYNRPNPLR
jgi:hypothetical protein